MLHYVLEQRFEEPFTDPDHNDAAAKLDPCLEARGVRWVRSYLADDRLRMICEFEADSAEAVRDAYRSAGIPFATVWRALKYERKSNG